MRLSAARVILEVGIKAREVAELALRFEEMEERLNTLEAGQNYAGQRPYLRVVHTVSGDGDPNAIWGEAWGGVP